MPTAPVVEPPVIVVDPVQQSTSGVPCVSREQALVHLAEKYGERSIAGGMSTSIALLDARAMIEVISTPDGSTWTIIATRADGWSCLIASGVNWRTREPDGTAL